MQAIARVRLAPNASRQLFEKQLRGIPAVHSAWHVTGDVDYEMRLSCPDLSSLRSTLRELGLCCGAKVASAGLVLGEVAGLTGPDLPDHPFPAHRSESS